MGLLVWARFVARCAFVSGGVYPESDCFSDPWNLVIGTKIGTKFRTLLKTEVPDHKYGYLTMLEILNCFLFLGNKRKLFFFAHGEIPAKVSCIFVAGMRN